jgi:hypothetical protein
MSPLKPISSLNFAQSSVHRTAFWRSAAIGVALHSGEVPLQAGSGAQRRGRRPATPFKFSAFLCKKAF